MDIMSAMKKIRKSKNQIWQMFYILKLKRKSRAQRKVRKKLPILKSQNAN